MALHGAHVRASGGGQLRDDVALAEASQHVHALGAALDEPASLGLAPLKDAPVGQSRGPLLIFMAATGVIRDDLRKLLVAVV